MSIFGRSLLSIDSLNQSEVDQLFQLTKAFKLQFFEKGQFQRPRKAIHPQVVGLLFLEPSTRTRVSFQVAAGRLNLHSYYVAGGTADTSMVKGESPTETFATMAAMSPDLMIVRHKEDGQLEQALAEAPFPIISGGCGAKSHPTQALLDAYTIYERKGTLEGQKVLFVGDVLHSRVAHSDLQIFQLLGAEVGMIGPKELLPEPKGLWSKVHQFGEFKEALSWCTVCMGLRIQVERHDSSEIGLNLPGYQSTFCIGEKVLNLLPKEALLMHPGPFVEGVDLSSEALLDPRCCIRDQVNNGVFTRAALMAMVLGWEY